MLEGERINHVRAMYTRGSHCLRFASVLQVLAEYVDEKTRFLDVGCAEGLYCGVAGAFGAHRVVGIDISQAKLDRAAEVYNYEFYRANCERDLSDYYGLGFNFVLCSEVLQHLVDWRRCVAEMVKCIDGAGYLLVTTSNLSKGGHEYADINLDMSVDLLLEKVGGGGIGGKPRASVWNFDTVLLEKQLVTEYPLKTIKRIPVPSPDGQIKELFTVLLFCCER